MALDYGQLVGGIASYAPALINGINQTNQAKDVIKQIGANGIAPVGAELQDAYDMTKENAKFGYLPGEEKAFKQALANAQDSAYKKALVNSGGNQSQAIWAALKSQNLNALNEFAKNNNAVMRAKQGLILPAASSIQNQKNFEKQLYNQKQLAAGQALASGRYDTQTATTNMGNFIASWFGGGVGAGGNAPQAKVEQPIIEPQYQPDVNSIEYNRGLNGTPYNTGFTSSGYTPPPEDFPTYYQSGPIAE